MRRSRRALTRRNPGLKPSNDSETDMTGANYQGTRFGHEKTSYATAEDSDSERAKNQIRIRSRGAPAERARSAYDGCMTT